MDREASDGVACPRGCRWMPRRPSADELICPCARRDRSPFVGGEAGGEAVVGRDDDEPLDPAAGQRQG